MCFTRRDAVDNGESTRTALSPAPKTTSEAYREKMPRMQTIPGRSPCCTASWTATARSNRRIHSLSSCGGRLCWPNKV